MQHSEQELMRLVAIGALRNGRVLYIPEPEYRLLVMETAEVALDQMILEPSTLFVGFSAVREIRKRLLAECFDALVADQQRVYDAIVHGVAAPFEPRALPTFAQILRYS